MAALKQEPERSRRDDEDESTDESREKSSVLMDERRQTPPAPRASHPSGRDLLEGVEVRGIGGGGAPGRGGFPGRSRRRHGRPSPHSRHVQITDTYWLWPYTRMLHDILTAARGSSPGSGRSALLQHRSRGLAKALSAMFPNGAVASKSLKNETRSGVRRIRTRYKDVQLILLHESSKQR